MIPVTQLCSVCGHQLSQKNRPVTIVLGVALVVAALPLLFHRYYWIAAVLMAAIGLFLLIWGILGKARWCSRCKKFPVAKSLVG